MTRRTLGLSTGFCFTARLRSPTPFFASRLRHVPLSCAIFWNMTKPSDFTEALISPSVARNRDPILSVLRRVLPPAGQVLEIASGTGEHAVHFAAALPHLTWQPTDRDEQALKSIAAHRTAADLPNLLAPLVLDAAAPDWPVEQADAIVAINMVHISPWRATQGLTTCEKIPLMDGLAQLRPCRVPVMRARQNTVDVWEMLPGTMHAWARMPYALLPSGSVGGKSWKPPQTNPLLDVVG
jgi:hypothetical protein